MGAPPVTSAFSEIDLNGARILITGGTGSFGRAFVRHVLATAKPARLAILSRDEMKQYEMAEAFAGHDCLRYFIGDVRDVARLEMAMRGVDYVIHAAALKHVTIAEYNPFECIHTNVLGAENVVRAAIRCGVKAVLALSTDKAACPINLYGASKLAADKIFVAANAMSGDVGTRFSVVRYGNVMGSRGSVVPLFQRLIREGATALPITDPRMTRFWITLETGVRFVLSSLSLMQGGEIFIPKIPSIKVVDLARVMGPKLPHRVIGIRPGEKLHESLLTEDDARSTTELTDRYVIRPTAWADLSEYYAGRGGHDVPENFSYTSMNNPWWLEGSDVASMLEQA